MAAPTNLSTHQFKNSSTPQLTNSPTCQFTNSSIQELLNSLTSQLINFSVHQLLSSSTSQLINLKTQNSSAHQPINPPTQKFKFLSIILQMYSRVLLRSSENVGRKVGK